MSIDWIKSFRIKITSESKSAKVAIGIISTVYIFFTAGLNIGWVALLSVLQKENVYFELCNQSLLVENETVTCSDQNLQLNLIYTVSLALSYFFILFQGITIDYVKSQRSFIINTLFLIVGIVMFLFSNSKNLELFIPGFSLIIIGGNGIFTSIVPLSEIYKSSDKMIITIWNGAADASGGVLVLLLLASKYLNWTYKFFLLLYLPIPCIGLILALFWPKNMQKKNVIFKDDMKVKSFVEHFKLCWKLIKKKDFLLFVLFFAIGQETLVFYGGSQEDHLKYVKATKQEISFLIEIQNYINPLIVLFAPVIGIIFKKMSKVNAITATTAVGFVFVIFRFITIPYVQIGTFLLQVLYRTCFASISTYFLVDWAGNMNFGKLWGICNLVVGVITLLQYLLVLALYASNNNWLPFDIGNLVILGISCIFPIFLYRKYRIYRKKKLVRRYTVRASIIVR